MSPSALALLQFIPEPNLPGTTRNYHYTTTTPSVNDALNARVTHTLAGTGRGGRGGRGGAGRRGRPRRAARADVAPRSRRRTSR